MCSSIALLAALVGCGDAGAGEADDEGSSTTGSSIQDITDAQFSDRTPGCDAYVGDYTAVAKDLSTGTSFAAQVRIELGGEAAGDTCTLSSNGIPNHDFGDLGPFVTPVGQVQESFTLAAKPSLNDASAPLSLMLDDGVLRNGVKIDLLAAACYGVGPDPLGQEKIGCFQDGTPWRYDPISPSTAFGEDSHHAHTQPDGAYHYHGDPNAMYDPSGAAPSGLIGWAADGVPIYGPYFDDGGIVRKAVSGYSLRQGARVSQPGEAAFPGGDYDGTFIDDYEFTGAGDLDACNGMSVAGVYGYYVTEGYPYVIGCFRGTPDASFAKGMPPPPTSR